MLRSIIYMQLTHATCCTYFLVQDQLYSCGLRGVTMQYLKHFQQKWGFLKWWVSPTNPWVFPTKNNHFGVEIEGKTHHFRKHQPQVLCGSILSLPIPHRKVLHWYFVHGRPCGVLKLRKTPKS